MVAVVGKQETALLDEQPELGALVAAEAHELVAGHEEKRERQQILGVGRDHDLLRIHGDGRVLHERIEHVGGDLRVVIPVARSRSGGARTRTRRPSAGRSARPETIPSVYLTAAV